MHVIKHPRGKGNSKVSRSGQASFKASRRLAAEHGVEVVGEKLRAMMPWIAENQLVDKTKN